MLYEAIDGEKQEKLVGIGSSILTLGTFKFFFYFGRGDHSVTLNIMPEPTPLIISRKDLDSTDLDYQTCHKN